MSKKQPVTDHALLRYIERVIGLDLEKCKAHMMTPGLKTAVKINAASYQSGGFTYMIDQRKVVTVVKGKPSSGR